MAVNTTDQYIYVNRQLRSGGSIKQRVPNPNYKAPSKTPTAPPKTGGSAQTPAPKPTTPTPKPTGYTKDQFLNSDIGKQFIDATKGVGKGDNPYGPQDRARAYEAYVKGGSKWTVPAASTPKPAPGGATGKPGPITSQTQVVPGAADPKVPNQMNVVDYAGKIVTDPNKALTKDNPATPGTNESMYLADHAKQQQINPNTPGTNINPNDPKYQVNPSQFNAQTQQATASQAGQVQQGQTKTYNPFEIFDGVAQENMEGAQGELSEGAIIDEDEVPQHDMNAIGSGVNPDGTPNWLGQSLKEHAEQDLDAVNPKATVAGQLAELQAQFVGPNGEPKIPAWAQGTARNVQKIAAFGGMTGTAATAALANAIMEASLPIAQQDAQFFQTLTIQNLNNKQQSIINRANVLANLEVQNMDARTNAAIENSRHFLQMDLANLSNEQQANMINNQNRIQALFEDGKQINAQRLFTAQSQNEMDMFYDNLNSQVNMFNTAQVNGMKQFNTSEQNATNRFNAELENSRQKFYQEMQFNIDIANAKWRQTVTLTEDQQAFEAASQDVKNLVGISVEQLNQLWDRSDSMLQYLWQSSENEMQRKHELALGKMQAKMKDKEGTGAMLGSIVGAGASSFFDWLF